MEALPPAPASRLKARDALPEIDEAVRRGSKPRYVPARPRYRQGIPERGPHGQRNDGIGSWDVALSHESQHRSRNQEDRCSSQPRGKRPGHPRPPPGTQYRDGYFRSFHPLSVVVLIGSWAVARDTLPHLDSQTFTERRVVSDQLRPLRPTERRRVSDQLRPLRPSRVVSDQLRLC